MRTFRRTDAALLSPQHPVNRLALIRPEDGNENLVLDVVRYILVLFLALVPHVIVQLLHVLPLQVRVALLLLVLNNF